ncbi:MAG: 30S ribosome-binding factor RbfA [Kiritimatiellae bacterium]|nr:30S ribosome-binding factor RbfA [Kiritimatiellia bacterium]
MSVDRLERVNSLLRRVIGDAMFRVLMGEDVSAGLVTVTGVSCGKDLRNATVRVSVFGDDAEQRRVLGSVIRHAHEFERIVNREARLKFTPQLRFVLDHSLEKGDHVLAILDTLPAAQPDS